jgi:hypothetical protein
MREKLNPVDNLSYGKRGTFRATYQVPKPGETLGRFPSNFILEHTADCTPEVCSSECPVFALGVQSGVTQSVVTEKNGDNLPGVTYTLGNRNNIRVTGFLDKGTAARFFKQVRRD